jgi:hypothetical protein
MSKDGSPEPEGIHRPRGGEAAEPDVEGHGHKVKAVEDEDVEGHGHKVKAVEDEDVEGHGHKVK